MDRMELIMNNFLVCWCSNECDEN